MNLVTLDIQIDPMAKDGLNKQISDQITEKIAAGEIVQNDKLPPERNLANQLNVSRDVVRRAYSILKENGFIESQGHDGWLVTKEVDDDPKTA